MLGRCGLRWLRPARCGAGRGPHPRFCGPVHQIAAARLAPARISIAAAAARVIDVSGMAFSKPLRTAIAIVATDHSASTDPIPTATGSWYLAARPAVRIWVRSPNSATRITVKLVAATPRTSYGSAHTDVVIPVAPSSPQEQQWTGQEQDGDHHHHHHLHRRWGRRASKQPTATAKATWSAKAATPAKTNPGRCPLPRIKLASAVLSGSSAGKSLIWTEPPDVAVQGLGMLGSTAGGPRHRRRRGDRRRGRPREQAHLLSRIVKEFYSALPWSSGMPGEPPATSMRDSR